MRVLGIETSCDETAASVVDGGTTIVSSVVSSQIDLHARYGGVVPELAGRAHVELLTPVLADALEQAGSDHTGRGIDGIAVTHGPGLIGSLLVGVAEAKALSMAWGVPLVGVNHLEAHLFASLLEQPDLGWPLVVLLVSGGHTLLIEVTAPGEYRLMGGTIDDAAGEAFDKVARFIGLGYPGGPAIDRLAPEGDPPAFAFPRSLPGDGYDFSFSGLKTSVVNRVRKEPDASTADVAASFQEAVVDVLVTRARRAAADVGARALCLAGGVAANSLLRARVERGLRGGRHRGVPARPGPVHRQRGHGGRRRALAAHPGGPQPPRPRAPTPTCAWSRPSERPSAAARRRAGTRGARLPSRVGPGIVGTLNLRLLTVPQEARTMSLHPLDDRIVVQPGESEETTASGLVIPDTAKEKPQQGEVLAVGPGRRSETTGELIPLDIAVGDTVVYSKYGGTEISADGKDLLILSSRDILAKVTK